MAGTYLFSDISEELRYLMSNPKQITKIIKCRGSVGSQSNIFNAIGFFHLEIILEIENTVYLRISFGKDGLEMEYKLMSKMLIDKRRNNKIIEEKDINSNTLSLKKILIVHQNKPYQLFSWNCKHFAEALWEHFTRRQNLKYHTK
jgi:predicted nucleic-acid-binding Zn-ribbon protein